MRSKITYKTIKFSDAITDIIIPADIARNMARGKKHFVICEAKSRCPKCDRLIIFHNTDLCLLRVATDRSVIHKPRRWTEATYHFTCKCMKFYETTIILT